MARASAVLALAALAALVPDAPAQAVPQLPGARGEHPVTARLVAAETGWRPGQRTLLGVHLSVREGWHVYWKGQNDSGLPVAVETALPDGWRADALLWPAPERHVWSGEFVDHVHHGEVLLLLPVHVPADAEPGSQVSVVARLDWLVCEEACLPGGAEVELTLPVLSPEAPPAPSADAALVQRALEALPGEPPSDLHAAWHGDELLLTVPGAAGLSFAPEQHALPFAELARTGEADGDALRLRHDPRLPGGKSVRGVLTVRRPGGSLTTHRLDLPGPPARS